jgi:hypothetical protein
MGAVVEDREVAGRRSSGRHAQVRGRWHQRDGGGDIAARLDPLARYIRFLSGMVKVWRDRNRNPAVRHLTHPRR